MLAELVDAVVGVDTHRDTHEAEIALPTGTPIATKKIAMTAVAMPSCWLGAESLKVEARQVPAYEMNLGVPISGLE